MGRIQEYQVQRKSRSSCMQRPRKQTTPHNSAEEAFHNAKNSFFAELHGLPNPNQSCISNPDLYIDEIDWDNNDDDKVININSELGGSVSSGEDEDDDDDGYDVVDYKYDIRIEDINPTGWDIDVEEFSAGKVLTGLLVGHGMKMDYM
ncbi:hypothetical protein CDL12_09640 [Handroanthus impetiginosus]|uniref:Uncharacterized protein n=1 Tax=Handroanthus impetiginosus TaxID=429701 RepID=A0A2G9HJK7_9LAMI|nr:hypothetical protein CDL12_09640 [Handroanthus impetiginosus]